jgi:hypothetical protein
LSDDTITSGSFRQVKMFWGAHLESKANEFLEKYKILDAQISYSEGAILISYIVAKQDKVTVVERSTTEPRPVM